MGKPAPLQHGKTYHIFARGTNRSDIFLELRNYAHFQKLYLRHVAPYADTFAYCLLKNHFHVLMRVHDEPLVQPSGKQGPAAPTPSQAVSNLLNAYAKAINKACDRVGSLFVHPFGRIEVRREDYLLRLVVYIHRNPQRHGLAPDFRAWKHSSYRALCSGGSRHLKRDETLAWFGGLAGFRAAHDVEDDTASPIVDENN